MSLRLITSTIAKKIGGDVEKTESELMSQLLGIKDVKHSGSLSELISGMKVDDEVQRKPAQRGREPERQDSDRGRYERDGGRNDRENYSRADNVRKSLGPPRDRTFQKRPE